MGNPIFDTIAQEIERGEIDKGLWTEAFAAANGNENATKARYIQFRARQFSHQAQRPLSAYDFGTAFTWAFGVGFCGLAGSGVFAGVAYLCMMQRVDLLAIMACFAAFCAWCSRALFRHAVARLTIQQPTRAYWILEFVVVAAAAFALAAYMNSKQPDPAATAVAAIAMLFIPYGFMARARAKRLSQTTAT